MGGRGASWLGKYANAGGHSNKNYSVSECVKTIKSDKQQQHIRGTPEWVKASREALAKGENPKSAFYENVDPQEIVNRFSGKGTIKHSKKSHYPEEYVDVGQNIGITYDKKLKRYIPTSRVQIVYSKKGTHVFPIKKRKGV